MIKNFGIAAQQLIFWYIYVFSKYLKIKYIFWFNILKRQMGYCKSAIKEKNKNQLKEKWVR